MIAPLLRGSIALHAVAALITLVDPSLWRWTLAAVVANHLLITVLSMHPRGSWLGRNLSRLPPSSIAEKQVAITIDDGPDPDVTPRVLEILDAHGVKATFFCIGSNVAAHPDLARDIVRRGHAIENHSEEHGWHFALSGVGGFMREIETAQRTIASITSSTPRLFRAPAGMRNPFLDFALRRLDLTLASWTRRGFDTVDRDPCSVLAALTRNLAAGDILLLHDGHAARTSDGTPVIVAMLPELIEAIRRAGLQAVTLRAALASESTPQASLRAVAR